MCASPFVLRRRLLCDDISAAGFHTYVSVYAQEVASEWILITFARHELKWRSEWDARCSVLTAQEPDAPLNAREAFSFVSNSSHINAARPFSCTGLWMIRHQRKLAPCYARMCLRVSWNVFCECSRCFRHHGCVVDSWLNPTCTLQYYGIVFFFVADTLWQWFSVGFWSCVGNLKLKKKYCFLCQTVKFLNIAITYIDTTICKFI